MARFDPSALRISGEDADALLEEVLSDAQVIENAHFGDWDDLAESYKRGPVIDGQQKEQGIGLVFAVLQSVKPYLFNSDPAIFAKARRLADKEERDRAKVVEGGLTHQWDESGARVEVDKILDDAMIFGAAFLRISYEPSGQFVPLEDYDRDLDIDSWADNSSEEEQAQTRLLARRMAELGLPPDVSTASVGLKRWSPYNVAFPAGYDEVGQMPRFAFRHLIPIARIQKDPAFKNTSHLKADKMIAADKKRGQRRSYRKISRGKEPGHVEVWEVWHVEFRTRLVTDPLDPKKRVRRLVREMHVTWLVNQGDPSKKGRTATVLKNRLSEMDMEGYPVKVLRLSRAPDSFFGPSLAAQILPMAKWIQELVVEGVEGLKAAMALKTLFNPDMISKNGQAKLASRHPDMVPVRSKLGVGNAVANLILPAFPQEYQGMLGMLNALISRVSGSDEVVQGGRSSAGSATEVAFRASVLQGRSQYQLRVFEQFLRDVLRMMLQVMQQYFEAERWGVLSGIDEPVSYSRDEIRGEWLIGIHAGSTRPRTPQDERSAMIGFLEALASASQAMQAAGVPPEVSAAVLAQITDMWEQNFPELLDGFAAMVGTAAASAGPPMVEPGPGNAASGAAVNPADGESLTVPAAGRLQAVAGGGGIPAGLQE